MLNMKLTRFHRLTRNFVVILNSFLLKVSKTIIWKNCDVTIELIPPDMTIKVVWKKKISQKCQQNWKSFMDLTNTVIKWNCLFR